MKKLFSFSVLVLLVSCTCIPQIPPQTIYADQKCEGTLPNYLEFFNVRDNCPGATLTQDPLPGVILDASNPWIIVTIEAKDISGNTDRERFDVVLLDTIPPELIIDSALLSYTWEHRSSLLRAYHTSLGHDMYKASQGPDSIWTHSMLRDTSYWEPNPWLNADSIFDNHSMLMLTSPGFNGASWGTFIDTGMVVMPLTRDQLDRLGYKTYKIPITVQ